MSEVDRLIGLIQDRTWEQYLDIIRESPLSKEDRHILLQALADKFNRKLTDSDLRRAGVI